MKIKTKKAFTLIELIAVILILGIIALIGIPTVTNIVSESQKKAFEVTCSNVYKALEKYQQYENLKGTNASCTVFDFASNRDSFEIVDEVKYEALGELEIKGKLPVYGTGRICGDVIELVADNGKFTCVVDEKSNQVLDGVINNNDVTPPLITGVTLSSTLNTIRIVVEATEEDGRIEKYYYKVNNKEYVSENNYIIIEDLEKNTNYNIEVIVENKSGLKSEVFSESIKTKGFSGVKLEKETDTEDEGYEYSTEATVKVSIGQNDLENVYYYFKTTVPATVLEGIVVGKCGTDVMPGECTESNDTEIEPNVWYKSTVEPNITFKENGLLYVIVGVENETTGIITYDITKIDTTEPSASLTSNIKTNRAILSAGCTDLESGITKYEFSKDNGQSYTDNGSSGSYIFEKLEDAKDYTFKVRCTNGAGLQNEDTNEGRTLEITNPTIEKVSETKEEGYTWATERVIGITYVETNIENPEYYFKSTTSGKVAEGIVTHTCGTETLPVKSSQCEVSNVTELVAGYWYKTNNTSVNVTYTSNGVLYALTSDGVNISGTSSYDITNTSPGTPSTPVITGGSESWSSSAKTISVSTLSTETSQILKYQYYISTSNTGQTDGAWYDCTTSATSQSIATNGTRYVYFRTIANNGKISSVSNAQTTMIDTLIPSAPAITGGSDSWSNSAKTISVSTEASAYSGISYYQYYISTSNTSQTGGSWKDLASGVKSITISENGVRYIYFRGVSGVNKAGEISSYQTTKVDTGNPTVTVSVSGKEATLTLKDGVGIVGYGVNQSTTSQPSYTPLTGTDTSATWTATAGGTYVAWVKDNAGRTDYEEFTIAASAFNYAATVSCDSGYTLNGNTCSKTYQSGTSYSCPNGGTLSGTTCTTSSSYAATCSQYKCTLYKKCNVGEGFSCASNIVNNQCAGVANSLGTVNCDGLSGYPNQWCDSSTYKRSSVCGGSETVYGSDCNNASSKTCSSYTCPNGGTLSGTTCTTSSSYGATGTPQYSTDTKTPNYSCPNGGTLSGTTCVF